MGAPDARERILCTATALFAEKGYGSTSVREVVEAAGVTKPTLYYYFGSKEALFVEAVKTHMAILENLVTHAVESGATVRDRLKNLVVGYVGGAHEHPDAVRLLMTAHHPSADDQPEVDIMSMHLRNAERLKTVIVDGQRSGEIRPDLDTERAVLALTGLMSMWVKASFVGRPLEADFADQILNLFFDGVGTR